MMLIKVSISNRIAFRKHPWTIISTTYLTNVVNLVTNASFYTGKYN
jgi:hypothetical protein